MSSLPSLLMSVYIPFALHLFSLCGCWHASCLRRTTPPFLPWPFVLPSQSGLCSSRGWSYTSTQCLRYPGRCRRWSRPPGRPSPAAQSLECQRWRIHWPSKMAWRRCAPGRTLLPWQHRLTPPAGVSVGTLMPQRTTWRERVIKKCQRNICKPYGKTKGDYGIIHLLSWLTFGSQTVWTILIWDESWQSREARHVSAMTKQTLKQNDTNTLR